MEPMQLVGRTWITSYWKRVCDFLILLPFFPLLLVLTVAMMIAVIVVDRAVPIIRQVRIGRGGKPFVLYKINTMGKIRGSDPGQGANDPRATRLGRVLRLLVFDEIPQKIINVPRGDMGMVGPRPLLPADIALMKRRLSAREFRAWYRAYTIGRPGWTGKFGVMSRCFAPETDAYLRGRLFHDVSYSKTATLATDLRIVWIHYSLFYIDLMNRKRMKLLLCIQLGNHVK